MALTNDVRAYGARVPGIDHKAISKTLEIVSSMIASIEDGNADRMQFYLLMQSFRVPGMLQHMDNLDKALTISLYHKYVITGTTPIDDLDQLPALIQSSRIITDLLTTVQIAWDSEVINN